ncbi:hypothetical protein [Fibrella forsythiae]|uniref:STAS/SEC14 domain-containing protein n=1 Tax=Fibrella forsythiae TaxID=2817061 RepID=A0ABS3JRH6_9BACT|nr:hypothetical protein [Fibrella forsythiae]MBO0952610.1 hypothetical protein [Fibrella forsythiae]
MKTYRNEHAVILVDGGVHLIQQVWTGVPSSENFRDGSIASLTLAKRHHIKRWLVDLRTLRLFNPIDLQWFVKSWLPEAVHDLPQNGRVAILLNEYNQFGKLGADLLLRASTNQNPALSSRYFLSDQEARDWLLRAPEA